ncbi:DUF5060 domain-containing protein [Phycisphaera mikurensis]|uniref:DUF5060 domain-containing protein n=1 Tax=Phycisphaera mikurensis (strain NBRC 102666 / KCTC 22515 / FYK2301M01) TaxID=1142394 RepID=I0ICZ5_PHYMF|nr:DUF5060 domain-containing protein [Phycisphaera mikurensis]MBB6442263.1 hypothetical protein [Phycisphaera mikurensis]BAM03133.1 hypothetical protein PSMK_09740 [Phycisphaera mikurensis NBRC 102666]
MHRFLLAAFTTSATPLLLLLTLTLAGPAAASEPPEAVARRPVTLDFPVEETSETAADNPFLNRRLQVRFEKDGEAFSVPGFYAADGDAAETDADAGGVYRVRFTPPAPGTWRYEVAFRRGPGVAIDDDPRVGEPVAPHDGTAGTLAVAPAPADATGFAASGGLIHPPGHYVHTRDGGPVLLFGPNSPENFLAYEDFDGTSSHNPERQLVKSWGPHVRDWNEGDPTWRDGLGKGILGALNYIAGQGMNVVYVMTLTLEGDASDVWPFIGPEKGDFTRFDVSKLDQWEIVFAHAERLGVALELILQEQENQMLLDDGNLGPERKLYLRELTARFGHLHNLLWNIGEENGPGGGSWPQGQNDQQRLAMIRYLKDNDPYKRPVLMHTYYTDNAQRNNILEPLLRYDRFDGISLQSGRIEPVHHDVKKWIDLSAKRKRPWIVLMDEIGPWQTGTLEDDRDPAHNALRQDVLWGALTAGAGGVQWYFGWFSENTDLNTEDWRTRENMWEQTLVARRFFEDLPFTEMSCTDELVDAERTWCFSKPGEVYAVYLKEGGTTRLDLREEDGTFEVRWLNPRTGGELQTGTVETVTGGDRVELGFAPAQTDRDWAVRVRRSPPR